MHCGPHTHTGKFSYIQLRERALGHCSLTFFVNEANHKGATGPSANVAFRALRPRAGGLVFALQVLRDIRKGDELLVTYNQLITGPAHVPSSPVAR